MGILYWQWCREPRGEFCRLQLARRGIRPRACNKCVNTRGLDRRVRILQTLLDVVVFWRRYSSTTLCAVCCVCSCVLRVLWFVLYSFRFSVVSYEEFRFNYFRNELVVFIDFSIVSLLWNFLVTADYVRAVLYDI